jgi:hypothetical protein
MKAIPEFQELAIVLTANDLNPTLLMPEFLERNAIVPEDWELAQPPQFGSYTAKIEFVNNVIISTDLDTITFSESLESQNPLEAKTPTIVRKYIEALPRLDYQLVEINPSSFFTFEAETENTFRHYIPSVLLTSGAWKQVSKKPLRASVSLSYLLEQGQFYLKIDDVKLQQSDDSFQSAVLFSGNFIYEVSGETASEKVEHIYNLLELWQEDLAIYRDLVNHKFLGLQED